MWTEVSRNPEVFVKTNVLGTLVMLNAAKSAWELPDGTFKPDKKFLHVSTDEVYGSLEEDGGFFYETTPYDPHSPYSASKASSDMLVKSYMDTYKFPANITNCSNNYGRLSVPGKTDSADHQQCTCRERNFRYMAMVRTYVTGCM